MDDNGSLLNFVAKKTGGKAKAERLAEELGIRFRASQGVSGHTDQLPASQITTLSIPDSGSSDVFRASDIEGSGLLYPASVRLRMRRLMDAMPMCFWLVSCRLVPSSSSTVTSPTRRARR